MLQIGEKAHEMMTEGRIQLTLGPLDVYSPPRVKVRQGKGWFLPVSAGFHPVRLTEATHKISAQSDLIWLSYSCKPARWVCMLYIWNFQIMKLVLG